MNETKMRIAEYKKKLPKLKEKVLATALLVILAFAMATTSTFAWLVLSRAPEVSGATTSLAANGNLEIALVGPEGKIPAESAVGDSNLDLILKNITWGNLINLSDPRYGLDNLVLRPAQLNPALLNSQPLYGAEYSEDGRIEKLNDNFGYATWKEDPNVGGYFAITDEFGVRVISSVTREFVGADKIRDDMRSLAKDSNTAAGAAYRSIANNKGWMQSLATMMGLYMTARMNPDHATLSNPDCDPGDVQNLAKMYEQFMTAFEQEAEAMAHLLNYQIFLINGTTEPTYTGEDIWDSTKLPLSGNDLNKKVNDANGVAKALRLTNLKTFRENYNTIKTDIEKLRELTSSGGTLKWKDSGLNTIVNNLVNVGTCTVGANNTPINSIGASNAMQYLSGTQEAKITNGILYNFEYRTGNYIEVKELSISATVNRMGMTIPATVKANVTTTAPRDTYLFLEDLMYSESLYTGEIAGGEMVANDTYGLALDFWVRTNAENSFLMLGGNVLIETKTERAKGRDADGNEVELYVVNITLEVTDENGDSVSVTEPVDLYQIGGKWYNASSYDEFKFEDYGLSANTQPREKFVEVEYVVGYEGENRVWDGSYGLSVNSTTQGSGSCYVFYADTPEDQAKSLTLLAAMKIAFADASGKKLATAVMDTEHFYAKDGKVIVPMVLSASDSLYIGDDTAGNPCYAIAALRKNEATRLTAILYLDGTMLDNSQVLSAASIQGQLNVQFESSVDLNNIDNEELRLQELNVSAALDKTSFNYDEASETNPMITNVAVTVEGTQPRRMEAFFIRKINDTQGSREDMMTFTYDPHSKNWVTAYEFSAPGNYVLRSVRLDGIEYDLATPKTVTIEGFTLTSLDWDEIGASATFMTANTSVSTNMTLSFASNDVNKMPKTVYGRFIRESDGSVSSVQFVYDPVTAKWKGTAIFAMSGEYSLQYLVLDGEYQEIPENMQKTVTAYLGMRVQIYTTSPHSFKYLPAEMQANGTDLLHMQVVILDDSGNQLPGLTNVKLTYHLRGSLAKKVETSVKWDAGSSKYKGDFDAITAGAGIYEFLSVQVGDDTITNAMTSPIFTMISPEPPVFLNADGNATYLFREDGSAFLKVQMKYVGTADVLAKISDGTNDYWVKGTAIIDPNDETETISDVTFIIPNGTAVSGKQDGNWTLKEINVWNYYDAAGNWIEATIVSDEKGLVSEITPAANAEPMSKTLELKTKVVATVKINFPSGQDKNFTGAFMQEHIMPSSSNPALRVTISDFEGQAIDGISNVLLKYTYNNDSLNYGGYTSSFLTNAEADFTITLEDDGSHTNFVQSNTLTLKYAGSWSVVFSFQVGVKTYTFGEKNGATLPSGTPRIMVSSTKPTVEIASISPNGTHTSLNGNGDITVTSKIEGNTVTIYCEEKKNGNKATIVTYPRVVLRIQNMGFADSAVMTFDMSTDYMYVSQRSNQTKTYQWAAGTTDCTRYFGNYTEGGCSSAAKTGAGTATSSVIVLEYDGQQYTVDLGYTITINNPTLN